MPTRTLTILLSCAVVISCDVAGAEVTTKSCVYDRARLLALDENQFDQDMSGGWRALSAKPGCNLVAADLLHDYREAHHNNSDTLFWHEAQLRAFAGQYQEAVALMEQSYKPADADKAGWNPYVDATIAFLRKDRAALETAKSRLAVVQPPSEVKGMPPVVNGYMEIKFAGGVTKKFRWPPNIDVVEGLENCFDKPYEDAYGEACRQSPR